MGMQSQCAAGNAVAEEYREAVRRYGALGLEIQITELDVFSPDTSEAACAVWPSGTAISSTFCWKPSGRGC